MPSLGAVEDEDLAEIQAFQRKIDRGEVSGEADEDGPLEVRGAGSEFRV